MAWRYAIGTTSDKGKTWSASVPGVKDLSMVSFLNAMGERDWELVESTQHPLGDRMFFFKQPAD